MCHPAPLTTIPPPPPPQEGDGRSTRPAVAGYSVQADDLLSKRSSKGIGARALAPSHPPQYWSAEAGKSNTASANPHAALIGQRTEETAGDTHEQATADRVHRGRRRRARGLRRHKGLAQCHGRQQLLE